MYIVIACYETKYITYLKNYNKLHNLIISILLYKQHADINYILSRKETCYVRKQGKLKHYIFNQKQELMLDCIDRDGYLIENNKLIKFEDKDKNKNKKFINRLENVKEELFSSNDNILAILNNLDDVITDISKIKSLIPFKKHRKSYKNKKNLTLPLKVIKKRGKPKKSYRKIK
jgi:uncharacterized protein (UPF0335 family)